MENTVRYLNADRLIDIGRNKGFLELYNELKQAPSEDVVSIEKIKNTIEAIECCKHEDVSDGSVDNRLRCDWESFNKGLSLAVKILKRDLIKE